MLTTILGKIKTWWFLRAAAFSAVFAFVLGAVYYSPYGATIESISAQRLEYLVRSYLQVGPGLDSRIKLFVLDDPTVNELGFEDLDLKDWQLVMQALAEQKPKAIFFDRVYSVPRGIEIAAEFNAALKHLGLPIIGGIFAAQFPISKRPLLDLKSRPEFDIKIRMGKAVDDFFIDDLRSIDWLPVDKVSIYGPKPEIESAFTHLGHLNYSGNLTVKPAFRIDDEFVIPHWSFYAAENIRFAPHGLLINGKAVGLDRYGQLPINLDRPSVYTSRSYSMKQLILNARAGKKIPVVKEGDVVIIAPEFSTGNSIWFDSPYGDTPGAYFNTAVINSILADKWIYPAQFGGVWLIFFALLGAFVSSVCNTKVFWPLNVFIMVGIGVSGLMSFAYVGYRTPWVFCFLAYSLPSLVIFIMRALQADERAWRLKMAFEGVVSTERLQEMLANQLPINFQPRPSILTICSIDIAGFSLKYDSLPPADAFDALKMQLASITRIVHKHSGVIDNVHNHGLYVYFGHDFLETDREKNKFHADQALQCAIELQETQLQRNLQLHSKGNIPPYPLRIGINTAAVYIGDLGTSERHVNLSVVGYGIIDAKMLEQICDDYRIVISNNTKTYLSRPELKRLEFKKLNTREQIRSSIEAFEYDPFHANAKMRLSAIAAFRNFYRIERLDERRLLPPSVEIKVITEQGVGRLINYSNDGICVSLPFYLAKTETISLRLDCDNSLIAIRLQERGISDLICEVRWGEQDGKDFKHGLLYKNISQKLSMELLGILDSAVSQLFNLGEAS